MPRIAKGKIDYYETPLDIFVEDLLDLHGELMEDVGVVEGMLAKAGIDVRPKPAVAQKPKRKRKKTASAKRSSPQVSAATKQRVLDALRRAERPVGTRAIAEMIEDLSPGSVSKAIKELSKDGAVVFAGNEEGLERGRRPLYEAAPQMVERSFPGETGAFGNGGEGEQQEEVPTADERTAPMGPA